MFKFLRQYNKWILVVFGGLLMIAFLVPTAIQEFSRRSASLGGTWAEVGGSKVTEAERMRIGGQLQTLEAMQTILGYPVLTQVMALTGLNPREASHWYLLEREAKEAGFVGGADEGRAWLQEQLLFTGSPLTEAQVVGQLAGASRQPASQVLEGLSSIRGVLRMLEMASVLPISDSRAKLAASEAQMMVSADIVVLDASKPLLENEPAAPSQEAMLAQFDKYRDVAPGAGERGFGYRIPDRVKLEWFRIPVESVRASLDGDPRLSELEVRKAFLKDPGAYVPPAMDGTFASFDEVANEVREKVLDAVVRDRMSEIERFVEDQAALTMRGVVKRGGYYDITDEQRAKQLLFADLVASVSEQFKIPVPEYHGDGGQWLLPADANKIERLGTASTLRFGPRARRLSEMLSLLREFGGSPTLLVQEGVIGPPLTSISLTGGGGDIFFYRVVASEAAHAPESIDEVADTVRNDLLRLARFEILVQQIPAIEAMVATGGLTAVAEAFGSSVQFMPRISESMPAAIPGLGLAPTAVRSILERAAVLPKTTPVADLPEAERTFVVEAPDQLAVLVTRVTSLMPLAIEDFQRLTASGTLRRSIASRVPTVTVTDIYGIEPLSSRHQFKVVRIDEEPANANASVN